MVVSFSNGTATIDLKDSAGKSYKPNALIITLETNTGSIVYDWDNSTAGNILLLGRTYNGTGYVGSVRIAFIAVIP